MNRRQEFPGAVLYALIAIATVVVFSAIFVVIHEHVHSTVAFLLGHMTSPFAIEWGTPVTLEGWAEGVSYSALFAAGQGTDAAIIAVAPLVLHALIVIGGLYAMQSKALAKRKWIFHCVFWLVVVNLMELFSYMPVRAFALHGDIGNINHGLGLSPWVLFLPGTALVLAGLYFLYGRVLPRMNVVVAGESRLIRYVILVFSAFVLFIERSSSHTALSVAPDMQWATSLFGYTAFVVVLWYCRPTMPWVAGAEEACRREIRGGDAGSLNLF